MRAVDTFAHNTRSGSLTGVLTDPQASGSGGVRQPRSEPVKNANTLEDEDDLPNVMTSSGPSVAAIFAAKTALRQTMRARLANLTEGALASQCARALTEADEVTGADDLSPSLSSLRRAQPPP